MLKTRTAYQIFKADDSSRTSASFASLAKELALPYKIRAAEETFVAALGIVEKSLDDRRTYGPSTLHAATIYLSELASFIPLAVRIHGLESVTPNYAALERVAELYDVAEPAREALSKLSETNADAAQVPMQVLDSVLSEVAARERALRQELRDAGEKGVTFRRTTRSASNGATAGDNDNDNGNINGSGNDNININGNINGDDKDEENAEVAESAERAAPPGKKRRSRSRPATATTAAGAESDGKTAEEPDEAEDEAPVRKAMRTQKALVFGRPRALSNQEKKVVALLTQFVQLLGHVYAVRCNNLLPIFDLLEEKTRQAQDIINAERAEFHTAAAATAQTTKVAAAVVAESATSPNTEKVVSRKTTVEPFFEVSLTPLLQAIQDASTTFRTDEDCRYELDEDLLHPIAHACLSEINRIEGFTTVPFAPPSEEALEAKAKARLAARAKREEQRNRALKRARAREELAVRREEDRRLVRARFSELDAASLVEDTTIKNPVPTAYVRYAALPLETPEQFERALFIWTMFTSIPRVLRLSQMPFSLFLKGLQSDEQRDNGLMEEVVQALLNLAMKELHERAPNAPTIVTRGQTWFDVMAEYVAVASGNRKKVTRSRQKPIVDDDDDDDDDDDSEDDDDDSDDTTDDAADDETESSSSSGSGSGSQSTTSSSDDVGNDDNNDKAKKVKKQSAEEGVGSPAKEELRDDIKENGENVVKEEEAPDRLQAVVKTALANLAELRQLATWGNIDMDDRLTLLEYLVNEAVSTNAAQEEAERLLKQEEDLHTAMEKLSRELRDEAEREMKSLVKKFAPGARSGAAESAEANGQAEKGKDSYEALRQQLLDRLAERLRDVGSEHVGMQDGKDIGALIRPLGSDRYHRLFWRFPFNRCLYVQTTAATQENFPLLREPRELLTTTVTQTRIMFLDDEIESKQESVPETDPTDVPQRVWGTVPPEYLAQFIEGLDQRGVREAALRRSLKAIQPYLLGLSEPPVGRITRNRSHTFGYFNKLKLVL